MKVTVIVKPNSRQESIEKNDDGSLVIRVNESPVDGKANKRVIDLLAEHFDIPKSSIELLHGAAGKQKIFNIT